MVSREKSSNNTINTTTKSTSEPRQFKLRKPSNQSQKRNLNHYSRIARMNSHLLNSRGEQVINVRRSFSTENEKRESWQLNGESSKHALIREKAEQDRKDSESKNNNQVGESEKKVMMKEKEGKRRNARIDLSGATQDHIDRLWTSLPKSMIDRSKDLLKKEKKSNVASAVKSSSNSTTNSKHHHHHHRKASSSTSNTPPSHHGISSSPLKKSSHHESKKHHPKRQVESASSNMKASNNKKKDADFQILPSSVLVVHSFDAAASKPTTRHSSSVQSNENGNLWSSIAPISSWESGHSIPNGGRYQAAIISSQTTAFPSSLKSQNEMKPTESPVVNARSSLDSSSSSLVTSTSSSFPTSLSTSVPEHFSLPHNTPILIFIIIGSIIVAVTLLAGLAWLCRWSGSKTSKDKRRKRMKSSWSPSGNSSVFEIEEKDVDDLLIDGGKSGEFRSPLPELTHRNSGKGVGKDINNNRSVDQSNLNGVGVNQGYVEPLRNESGNGWTLFDKPVPKSKSMSSLSRESAQVDSEFKNLTSTGKGGNYSVQNQEPLNDLDVDVEQSIWPPPARRPSFIERLLASRPNSTLPITSARDDQQPAPPVVTGFSSNLTRSNTTMTQKDLSHSISMSRSHSNGSNLISVGTQKAFEGRKSLIENSINVGDFRKGPYPTIRPLPGYGIDTPLFTHPFSPNTKINPVGFSSTKNSNKKSNLSSNPSGRVFSSLGIFGSSNKKNERKDFYESDFEGTIGGRDKDLPKAKRLGKGVNRFTFEESTTEEGTSSGHNTPLINVRRNSLMNQNFGLIPPPSARLNENGNGNVFGTPRTPGLAGVGAARLWEEMEIQNQMLAQANAPFGSGPINFNNQQQQIQSRDFDNREMLSPLAKAFTPGENLNSSAPINVSTELVESNSMPSNLQVFETLRARQALLESKSSKLSMLPGNSNDYPNHPRTKLNEKIAKWWAISSYSNGEEEKEEILNDNLTPLPKTLEKKNHRQRKEVQRFSGDLEKKTRNEIPKLRRIKSQVGSEISEVTSISAVQIEENLKNPYLEKQLSIIRSSERNGQISLSQESENELVNDYYQLAHEGEEKEKTSSICSFSEDEKNATICFGELPQFNMSEEEEEVETNSQTSEEIQIQKIVEKPRIRENQSSKKFNRNSRRSSKATTRTESSLPPSYKTEGSSDEEFSRLDGGRTTRSGTTRSNSSSSQTSIFDEFDQQVISSSKKRENTAERAQLANQEWGVGVSVVVGNGEKLLRSLEKKERKEKKLENKREQRRRSRELNIQAARDMSFVDEIDQLEPAELQSRRHTVLDMPEDLQSIEQLVKPIRSNSNSSSAYSSINASSEYCAPLFSKKVSSSNKLSLPISSVPQSKRRSVSQQYHQTTKSATSIRIPAELFSSPDSPWTSSDSEISVRRWSSNHHQQQPPSSSNSRKFLVQKKGNSIEDDFQVQVTQPLRIISASATTNGQRKKNQRRSKD